MSVRHFGATPTLLAHAEAVRSLKSVVVEDDLQRVDKDMGSESQEFRVAMNGGPYALLTSEMKLEEKALRVQEIFLYSVEIEQRGFDHGGERSAFASNGVLDNGDFLVGRFRAIHSTQDVQRVVMP